MPNQNRNCNVARQRWIVGFLTGITTPLRYLISIHCFILFMESRFSYCSVSYDHGFYNFSTLHLTLLRLYLLLLYVYRKREMDALCTSSNCFLLGLYWRCKCLIIFLLRHEKTMHIKVRVDMMILCVNAKFIH